MRVLGFGTYDRARHPRAGVLLDGLQESGVQVDELVLPLGFSTAQRFDMLANPWKVSRLVARLATRWAGLVRRRYAAGSPEVVLVGYLGQLDVLLARALFPRAIIVLDLLVLGADTVTDRGHGSRLRLAATGSLDRAAMAAANVIVVDTAAHAMLVPERARTKVVVCPVGAGAAWYDARKPERATTNPLSVVFYGAHTPLQGTPVIGAALALLETELSQGRLRVTMIGEGQDLVACRRAAGDVPGVTWHGWIEPAELPGIVASHDICLGVFGTTAKGSRVVPHKVFEGAAAGCAIVTSGTAPQRESLGNSAVLVPPGDPAALATVLAHLVSDAALVDRLRLRAAQHADQAYRPRVVAAALHSTLLRKCHD